MAAACAGMSPLARLNHELSGLAGIRSLRALDDSLKEQQSLAEFSSALGTTAPAADQQCHGSYWWWPRTSEQQNSSPTPARSGAGASAASDMPLFSLAPCREQRGELWLRNTQVNFCARAYPTVPVQHPDAAALTVLGGFLRNGFLHRAIREQGGAYGGGASQDPGIAAFRFYSYRDPRLEETLQDFDSAIAWMVEGKHDYRALEEAILGVIGGMDKPSSPAGEAKHHFHNRLFGRSHEQREQFRQQVLAVSLEDLRRVTESYLQPAKASTAVITNSSQLKATAQLRENLGLKLKEL